MPFKLRPNRVPRLAARPSTQGRLVYAIGDIHGRRDLLEGLLTAVFKDILKHSSKGPAILVFLGDLIDRGPDPRGVVDILLELMAHTGIEVVALKGNHEQALLDFLDSPRAGVEWLELGGRTTLAAYGVAVESIGALSQTREAFASALPAPHLELFRGLKAYAAIGDYLFVHAGTRPGVPLDRQKEEDLYKIREPFLNSRAPCGSHVVVHGHTPTRAVFDGERRIGLDTGAYYSGLLSCVRLQEEERRFIAFADPRTRTP